MEKYETIPELFRENAAANEKTEAELMAQKAAQVISGLTDQYLVQVKKDLAEMKKILQKACGAQPDKRFKLIREKFFLKVHDMKGQGSTFGYPLLTEVGSYACNYLRRKKEITDADLDVLKGVVADIDRILTDDLTGMGGLAGSEIRGHLSSVSE